MEEYLYCDFLYIQNKSVRDRTNQMNTQIKFVVLFLLLNFNLTKLYALGYSNSEFVIMLAMAFFWPIIISVGVIVLIFYLFKKKKYKIAYSVLLVIFLTALSFFIYKNWY